MRSLRYIVPVLLFLVVAGFLLLGLDRNPSEIPSPLIGKPAPDWTLPRLATAAGNGGAADSGGSAAAKPGSLSGADLKGQPYLLNVWASWCAPCLQEHPVLVELAKRKTIRIVGINYKDRPEDARAWLARHGDPFAEIVADREGRTAIDFGVYGVPETFLVDAQGVIRFKHIGALTVEAVQGRLLPAIAALGSLPAASPTPAPKTAAAAPASASAAPATTVAAGAAAATPANPSAR
jgi:cytochrome c biogenesis protein CcmG/thiol:disulfide interchange protein DsbE